MRALRITGYIRIVMALVASVVSGQAALAFPADTYAPSSVLADGKWVKVSVSETGMHLITRQQLGAWGFSNPDNVRIYGYGATPISDVLLQGNYVDDLPLVQSAVTSKGIVFYAVGPVRKIMRTSSTLEHERNPYTQLGYYFLTEAPHVEPRAIETGGVPAEIGDTSCMELLVHEQELSSPGGTGQLMVDEDFNHTRSRSFPFTLTDRVPESRVYITCSFVAKAISSSTVSMSANGTDFSVGSADRIDAVNNAEHYGNMATTTKNFIPDANALNVKVTYNCSGSVSLASLNYLRVMYERRLQMPSGGVLDFQTPSASVAVGGVSGGAVSGIRVWDVTDPAKITMMEHSSYCAWRNLYSGIRHYAVWSESSPMPKPEFVANVSNQNLHALGNADMVIFAPRAYMAAAGRLADIHRNDAVDPMQVHVIDIESVFNEFGSGSFDPGALRRCLKMFYDRGVAQQPSLRYALMLGKGTFDNRGITGVGRSLASPMPLWVSAQSLQESNSYSTDDYFAFLEDGSGQRPGYDLLSIAVGRIPCTSAQEAEKVVDKIESYLRDMPRSDWRNRVLMLADDGNQGVHMDQTELMERSIRMNDGGEKLLFDKVYIDAYAWQNGSYPQARADFYRLLNSGAMLWTYIGHGSATALCGDNMITYTDINTQFYLRRIPFCYAATCSFLRWDNDVRSAAETLMFTDDGGFIGCISALRPVYISANGDLSKAFGTELSSLDGSSNYYAMGEVYRRAKNRLTNDTNRLRFVFMGDPALRTVLPSRNVVLESVNGETVTADAQITLKAREKLTLSGSVRDLDGSVMADFNGQISATLYDADYSTTSRGRGKDGKEVTFDQHGSLLFMAGGEVKGGRFTMSVTMPSDIADNFRPASLNLYAHSTESGDSRDASGLCRDLYVFGFDETAADDLVPPVIHSMLVNQESFSSGDDVNETPMVIARLSDDVGLNLSSSGVGHQMSLTVDGRTTYFDVAQFFTPDAVASAGAMSGSVAYQLPALSAGSHSLRLRVWDTAGNYAEETVDVNVVPGLAPRIFDVYTDTNPAYDAANFYVSHNRPDQRMSVTVTVYNLLGQPVWSGESTGRSDMFTSTPLTWDLTDNAGRRVNRGIYLYRATIQTAEGLHDTASRKIAVAAPR